MAWPCKSGLLFDDEHWQDYLAIIRFEGPYEND